MKEIIADQWYFASRRRRAQSFELPRARLDCLGGQAALLLFCLELWNNFQHVY